MKITHHALKRASWRGGVQDGHARLSHKHAVHLDVKYHAVEVPWRFVTAYYDQGLHKGPSTRIRLAGDRLYVLERDNVVTCIHVPPERAEDMLASLLLYRMGWPAVWVLPDNPNDVAVGEGYSAGDNGAPRVGRSVSGRREQPATDKRR